MSYYNNRIELVIFSHLAGTIEPARLHGSIQIVIYIEKTTKQTSNNNVQKKRQFVCDLLIKSSLNNFCFLSKYFVSFCLVNSLNFEDFWPVSLSPLKVNEMNIKMQKRKRKLGILFKVYMTINILCLFERPYEVQKNGVFPFEISFLSRDIDIFLSCKLDL